MKKITANEPESKTADIVADNIVHLKMIFPEAFTEGKIDFDVLKQLLGGNLEEREEKYGLNWPGKRRARQIAVNPSTGTLKPCPEESVNWDTTKNLMIEGDNLEVLKLLQKSYSGKVKLIYIDPPYNTGNDFVYPDDFTDSIKNYQRLTGQIDAGGKKLTTNTESSGRFHTEWLNMMYPRLKASRALLAPEGVIFVSIDDGELANVRMLLNSIFGEECFLACLARRTKSGGGSAAHHFAIEHDYVVAYCCDKTAVNPLFVPHDPEYAKRYSEEDANGKYFWDTMERSYTATKPYKIEAPDGTLLSGRWFRSEDRFKTDLALGEVRFLKKQDGKWSVQFKQRMADGKKVRSLLHENEFKSTHDEIEAINMGGTFQFPKPTHLVRHLIQAGASHNDIVLDFFAGSGTTGHAVMAQNAADGGNRRYILVQLPEPFNPANKDQKVAVEFCDAIRKPRNIAELTKERLRRSAKKIKEESPMFSGDLGFRVFKLDSSNIQEWDPNRENLPETLQGHIEHVKADRSESDILFELLLKLGLDLTVPIESKMIAGKKVYSVGAGVLLTCLDAKVETKDVEPLGNGIVAWHKELNTSGEVQVVFRDNAFSDDIAKTNLTAILEQNGISNVRSL